MLTEYVYKNHQRLRCGYTTGSCAAAAAKAAARMLLSGDAVTEITIATPAGVFLTLPVLDSSISRDSAGCAVRKDAGDDSDQTDGILIRATVTFETKGIVIDGGSGIGRVTKPGLEQPVGSAAINSTPRRMIQNEIESELARAGCERGMRVVLSAPQGEEIAARTFNPRLGIVGGISILGTSGIVEPMSEQALVETIRLEMRQRRADGQTLLFVSPGNYGQQFAKETFGLDLDSSIKCSNFIGETLDMALGLGFTELLLIGHIGKLVKIASGIMNTHSRMADARMETLCACALLSGCDADTARGILHCATTEEAVSLLKKTPCFRQTMSCLSDKILYHLQARTEQKMQTEVIVFSKEHGLLCASEHAEDLVKNLVTVHAADT